MADQLQALTVASCEQTAQQTDQIADQANALVQEIANLCDDLDASAARLNGIILRKLGEINALYSKVVCISSQLTPAKAPARDVREAYEAAKITIQKNLAAIVAYQQRATADYDALNQAEAEAAAAADLSGISCIDEYEFVELSTETEQLSPLSPVKAMQATAQDLLDEVLAATYRTDDPFLLLVHYSVSRFCLEHYDLPEIEPCFQRVIDEASSLCCFCPQKQQDYGWLRTLLAGIAAQSKNTGFASASYARETIATLEQYETYVRLGSSAKNYDSAIDSSLERLKARLTTLSPDSPIYANAGFAATDFRIFDNFTKDSPLLNYYMLSWLASTYVIIAYEGTTFYYCKQQSLNGTVVLNRVASSKTAFSGHFYKLTIQKPSPPSKLSQAKAANYHVADYIKRYSKYLSYSCEEFYPYSPREVDEVFAKLNKKRAFNTFLCCFDSSPLSPADHIDVILAHIREILADNNDTSYEFILQFLADLVADPRNKKGLALVFRSEPGAGKSLFFDSFGKHCINSDYYTAVDAGAEEFKMVIAMRNDDAIRTGILQASVTEEAQRLLWVVRAVHCRWRCRRRCVGCA